MSHHPFIEQVKHGLCRSLNCLKSSDGQAPTYGEDKFEPGVMLLLALSGGADSVALFMALLALQKELNFTLAACHINHNLRGQESDQDAEFCRLLAKKHNIPLEVFTDTAPEVNEAALRDKRYQFLQEAAQALESKLILVAHTKDDQVETFLFRLFRGSGIGGLTGMKHARPLSAATMLLRPMLQIEGSYCRQFLQDIGQAWREDPSNAKCDYTRNFIRHRVLPLVAERFVGASQHIESLRQILDDEDNLLVELAALAEGDICVNGNANIWYQERLADKPKAISRRILNNALSRRGIEPSFARIEEILNLSGQFNRLSLNDIWDVQRKGPYLIFVDKSKEQSNLGNLNQALKVSGLTIIPTLGKAIKIEPWNEVETSSSSKGCQNHKSEEIIFPAATDWQALVDLSAVELPLVIRCRRESDHICPLGMNESVKLKKYLHNHKTPVSVTAKARELIVIADQKEIIWIPGVGLSNKVKVKTQPSHKISFLNLAADEVPIC
jgi:tRNA(Ile)-lysidine synthase